MRGEWFDGHAISRPNFNPKGCDVVITIGSGNLLFSHKNYRARIVGVHGHPGEG